MKRFMLLGSYYFYGYWDWRFHSLLAMETVGNEVGCAGHRPVGGA